MRNVLLSLFVAFVAVVSPTKADIAGTWTVKYNETVNQYDADYTCATTFRTNGTFTTKGKLEVVLDAKTNSRCGLNLIGEGTYTLANGKIEFMYDDSKAKVNPFYENTPDAAMSIMKKIVVPAFKKGICGKHSSTITEYSKNSLTTVTGHKRTITYTR